MNRKKKKKHSQAAHEEIQARGTLEKKQKRPALELVVKSDGPGPLEAVCDDIESLVMPGVDIRIFRRGVGDVNKTDIVHAETGSRLVIGFNVGILQKVEEICHEHTVEVRLYEVIYRLVEDVERIAGSLQPVEEDGEEVTGSARVIAQFKCGRHDSLLGCEVLSGSLRIGAPFHVITAMGPVYTGKIESLHIERDSVREAHRGQQVGLKIRNFKGASIGDLIETFHTVSSCKTPQWQPQGKVLIL